MVGLDRAKELKAGLCGGVIDEIATKPGIWGPTSALPWPTVGVEGIIGVPEGRNSYWDMYNYAISGADLFGSGMRSLKNPPISCRPVNRERPAHSQRGNVRAGRRLLPDLQRSGLPCI